MAQVVVYELQRLYDVPEIGDGEGIVKQDGVLTAVPLATLDDTGKVARSQLPPIAITNTYPVASQAAMLALAAHRGDLAVRTDQGETYILAADDPAILGNWVVLEFTSAVSSVAGKTGTVALVESDIQNLVDDLAAKETPAGAQTKADTARTAAELYSDEGVAAHSSDTTSVHGIADTAQLETKTGAQAKADAAQAAIEAQVGQPSGIASLDSGGKVPSGQLPAIAINDTFVVASQAAMLALTAQRGDVAVRTDLSESLILAADDPTQLANWQLLETPASPVQSVAGKTGTVTLVESDISGLVSDLAGKQANLGVTLDTDGALAANSDTRVASEKATKAYVDAEATARTAAVAAEAAARATAVATRQADLGVTLDTDGTLAANSDTRVVSQKAIKAYADAVRELTPTAVKTGAYTAAYGDLVLVDTTAGAVTITLPAAAAGAKPVAVKMVTQGGSNAVSVACAGADVFNKTGGSATGTLSLLNQGIVLIPKAGVWVIAADDVALSQLDGRFVGYGLAPTPKILGSLSLPLGESRYGFVQGKYLYLTNRGGRVFIVDFTNDAAPLLIGSLTDTTNLPLPDGFAKRGDYLFIGNEDAGGGTAYFTVVDVSRPSNPTYVTKIPLGAAGEALVDTTIVGDFAFVMGLNTHKLYTIDISNPRVPVLVNTLTDARFSTAERVHGRGRVVWVGSDDKLTAVDVSNPLSPTIISSSAIPAYDFDFYADRYIIATEHVNGTVNGALRVVDIKDPTTPAVVGTLIDASLFANLGMCIQGPFAYCVQQTNALNLTVVDLRVLTAPTVVTSLSDGTLLPHAYSCFALGRHLITLAASNGQIAVWDIGQNGSASIDGLEVGTMSVYNDLTVAGTIKARNVVSSSVASRGKDGVVLARAGIDLYVKAGAPTDADFTYPRDGLVVLDKTNVKVWARLNGVWVGTVMA